MTSCWPKLKEVRTLNRMWSTRQSHPSAFLCMKWGPPYHLKAASNPRNLLARWLAASVLWTWMAVPILSRSCALKDLPHKRKKWPAGTHSPALVNQMPSESPPIMNHDGEIGHLLAYSARTTITSTAATKLIRSRGRRRWFKNVHFIW